MPDSAFACPRCSKVVIEPAKGVEAYCQRCSQWGVCYRCPDAECGLVCCHSCMQKDIKVAALKKTEIPFTPGPSEPHGGAI